MGSEMCIRDSSRHYRQSHWHFLNNNKKTSMPFSDTDASQIISFPTFFPFFPYTAFTLHFPIFSLYCIYTTFPRIFPILFPLLYYFPYSTFPHIFPILLFFYLSHYVLISTPVRNVNIRQFLYLLLVSDTAFIVYSHSV